MNQFEGLQEFAAVVEKGGFSAAARALRVSTAHVSRRVAALENRLGSRLLERTTRAVRATDAGKLAHARARALLDGVDDLRDELNELQSHVSGHVRVTAGGAYGERAVAPALARFCASNPAVTVELLINDRRIDLVSEGIDLAVRIGKLDDGSLIARKITQRRMILCAAPGYLRHAPELVSVDDLAQQACVVSPMIPWRLVTAQGQKLLQPAARFASNSIPALIEAALAGIGIAWVAELHVRAELDAGRLVEILPQSQSEHTDIWLVHSSQRHVPQRVRAVMEWLVAELQS
jgi:DNA-binding transcriptional LysR family regulator